MKKKTIGILYIVMTVILIAGCGENANYIENKEDETQYVQLSEPSVSVVDTVQKLAESYKEVYQEALAANMLGTQQTQKKIMECLGKQGYSVVDRYNKIDMQNPEKLEAFCEKVQEGKHAKASVQVLGYNGGLNQFDFEAENGEVYVINTVLNWVGGSVPEAHVVEKYPAYVWKYTEKGYLFFEQEFPSGYDGASGHTAIRVKPLTAECRKLNEMYLEKIGYEDNNIFMIDWKEGEYGDLNFFDIFENLYRMKYGCWYPVPESVNEPEIGIGELEFESVIQSYFSIDSDTLKKLVGYDAKKKVYPWRRRVMYETTGYTLPYPEVTACREEADGTLVLTVDAVWPDRNMDAAFTHEVTIRQASDGSFQYIANHVIPSKSNIIPEYIERLSEEEYNKYYQFGMTE